MTYTRFTNTALAISALMSTAAFAEGEPAATGNALEEVIVTGTPGGAELRKIDASFAISTLDAEAIARFAPASTADLFKAIPGVWVESSSGVAGANINLRGFPGTGDAPFVTVQLEGMPIYTPPTLSFLENSTLFRIDETIERVEGLRGGPNPVLSNGQPGLTTNFLLKRGGEQTEGVVRYTGADYGLQQVDAVMSGKLADDLYYMVGGYVRSSEGARQAGFNAEEGHQFTVNLTKEFDRGEFNVYFRTTEDAGTWYVPVPLNVPGIDASYTQISSANRNTVVEGPYGEDLVVDYGNGRGFDGFVTGGSFTSTFAEGWTLTERVSFLKGDADTYGLTARGGPRTLSSLGLASANTLVSRRTLGADDYVQHYGFWMVQKEIDSFSNDLSVRRELGRGSATLGYFSSRYGADDLWNLNNNARYLELGGAREQVVIDCATLAAPPSACVGGTRVNSRGDGRMNAAYLVADYEILDKLRLDVGARHVDHEISYVAETGTTVLTGRPNINTAYDEQGTSWTIGANYAFADNFGVFARINDGFRLPYFDDIRGAQTQLAAGDDLFFDVEQYEIGLKYASNNIELYATAFRVETQSTRSTAPDPGSPVSVFETESQGLELDASFSAGAGFSLTASATYLDGEITADPNPALIGNQAPRQPEWQVRLAPTYRFTLANLDVVMFAAISHAGDRQSNVENTQPLDSYEKFDLGVELASGNVSFRIFGDNITDEQGLTEGDPRSVDINANGRYILPRTVRFSIGYNF
jgi:outer membrane receptor protein involved in Fe transport